MGTLHACNHKKVGVINFKRSKQDLPNFLARYLRMALDCTNWTSPSVNSGH